ncbi:TonB-dependent receptor [candidate division WOR-3 bacterium]|nr:TonB-dependent receptor [candidate division WOR-3 bacterium]
MCLLKVILVTAFLISTLSAFHGAVEGKVTDALNSPLPGAHIYLENLSVGTTSDSLGNYFLELPMHGAFRVIYQFIGFKPETVTVFVEHGQRVKNNVQLKKSAIPLPAVETKVQREVIHEAKGPTPIVVIPKRAAEEAGKGTIGEAAALESGIQLQKRCSACEASEVSIQGLPGRFSLILLDGMPLFSNLASRYILDLVPIEFVERIEVLKGASGAFWGSDAVAGALNLILPEPARTLEARASYTRRSYGNDVSASLGSNLNPVSLSFIGAHGDRYFVDLNHDEIAENTAYRRDLLLATVRYFPGTHWRFSTGASFGDELRRGGAIVPDSEYGVNPLAEKVHTRRWDLWHSTSFTKENKELKLRLAGSQHQEDGIIETANYSAFQTTVYGELTGGIEKTNAGVVFSQQHLRDSRLFVSYNEFNTGIWASGKNLSLPLGIIGNDFLPALRVDFNSDYGTIVSPYGALKLFLGPLDLNIAAGTGFRTPTIIFESMENIPAGYKYTIRRDANLTRESSSSLQVGAARRLLTKSFIADLRLNFFRHRVANFITAKLDGLDSISKRAVFYYYNLDEVAYSTGAELTTNISFNGNLSATINAFYLVPKTAAHEILPFVKRWAINYSAAYRLRYWNTELSITGEVNGPMMVQAVHGMDSVYHYNSPVYAVMNLRLAKELGVFRLALGINNVWDYYQPPLQHHQEIEYYWGPIIGREFYASITVNL